MERLRRALNPPDRARENGFARPAGDRARSGGSVILLAVLLCSAVTAWAHDAPAGAHGEAGTGAAGERVDLVLAPGETPVLSLVQGHAYRIAVHARHPVELHLHGYDLTAQASADAPALFGFVAEHTGRFPIETHGDGDLLGRAARPVAFIEVRRGPGR